MTFLPVRYLLTESLAMLIAVINMMSVALSVIIQLQVKGTIFASLRPLLQPTGRTV
jgi:hypothetical protein